MAGKKKNDSEKKFEELLGELEALVSSMEREEADLEAALQKYERGMELSKECHRRLDAAEKKIMILRKKGEQCSSALEFDPSKEEEV